MQTLMYKNMMAENVREILSFTSSAPQSLIIIRKFEKELTKSQGGKFAVCTSSCTTGILSALEAIGVGPDNEVVVPALSWPGTWVSALFLGANLVPIDFTASFPVMDPKQIESKISKKTKAIIAVGLWGQTSGIAEINLISKKYNIPLVIDAAQLFNSKISGKRIGNVGDFVVFSFNNTKPLMALGEGGAILCSNKKLYQRLLIITQHPVRNFSEIEDLNLLKFNDGLNYNFRIHPFAALLGITKIADLKRTKHLLQIKKKREEIKKIAKKYKIREVMRPKGWIDAESNWTKLLFDVAFLDEDSLVSFRKSCQKHNSHSGFCCYKLISELEPVKEKRLFPWKNKSINVFQEAFPHADNWKRKLLIISLY